MQWIVKRSAPLFFLLKAAGWMATAALTSCAQMGAPGQVSAADQSMVREVTEKLVALPGAGEPSRSDARKIAVVAVKSSREQAVQYDVAVTGWFHNMMVNSGMKQRGLCWQWMEDIYPRLRTLHTKHFHIVCGVRDSGTMREHHCVVAVPSGRPFEDGLILDPWVKGGALKAFTVREAPRKWHYDPRWTIPLEMRALGAKRQPPPRS